MRELTAGTINSREFILKVLIACFCAFITGFIVYGYTIFNPDDHRFIFIVFGFTFSLFYVMLFYLGTKKSLLFQALLFIIYGVIFRKFIGNPVIISWDFIYYSLIVLSVYLFFLLSHTPKFKDNLIVYFTLAILFPAGAFLHHAVYILFNPIEGLNVFDTWCTIIPEALVGFGIGIGIYIGTLSPVMRFFRVIPAEADEE